MTACSHKFVGPNACAYCGATMEHVKAAAYDDALKLLHEQSAEVARLREDLEACENAAAKLLVAERAAHEATKTELKDERDTVRANQHAADREYKRRLAAEQRVAELEAIKPLLDAEALSSARGLLESVLRSRLHANALADLADRIQAWLRAHPEPATPAATEGQS